jgi:hypothetical protein
MPEHHARRIFLKVPEVEFYAEISVVEIVHGYVPCEEEKARTGSPKTEKAPSVAGGAFLGEVRLSLARATRRRSAVSGRRGGQCG